MITKTEKIYDVEKNEAELVYTSLFKDDEALIVIRALKAYICESKAPFSDKMKAGRAVESLASAREDYTEIKTYDISNWLEHKNRTLDMEVEADQYVSNNEVGSNEAN